MQVVYVDWRDRQYPPEIIGIFMEKKKAETAARKKETELQKDGYILDEDVHVIVEEHHLQLQ